MSRLGRLLHRRGLNADLADEIRAHIEERADELMDDGMSREDAMRAAHARFGNPTYLLEESRMVWSFGIVENLLRDLRIGARTLRKNALFTSVAVITLALGIGANAAIFSLIHAVLLRPLPFPQADRIAVLWEVPPKRNRTAAVAVTGNQNPVSPVNFLDWRDRTRSFEAMAAISPFPMGMSGFGEPREVDALQVSAAFFRVLGVAPLMGRAFTEREDVPDGPRVVVLSYGLWQERFGGSPAVLGRLVQLNDEPCRIIGVMPKEFDLPFQHADVWVPAQIARPGDEGRFLTVIARRKPGVTSAQAQADLLGVERQIGRERPFVNRDWSTNIVSLYDQTTGRVSTAMMLLFGAVTFVLLIACGNVANLLLMRGAQRRREMALRGALGASRARIASQLLAESCLLSFGGGLLGIALAWSALKATAASLPALALPRIEGLRLDPAVLAYSLALSVATVFLFGLAPAIAFSRHDPEEALKQNNLRATGRGGRRVRGALAIAEVTLSLVLLTGAALLGRSFLNQTSVNRGFRVDRILTLRMFFAPARYFQDARRARHLEEILERVRGIPGVEAASSAHFLPMTGNVSGSCFTRADRPEPAPGLQPVADFLIVSPRYFAVMGTPLIAGRDFNDHDRMGTVAGVIVNDAFSKRFFPGESPLGKQLNLCWNIPKGVIIGVAASTRQTDLTVAPNPTIFLDNAQAPFYFAALVVRTALPPESMARAVDDAVHAIDPDQPVSHVETMEQVVADSVARPRVESILLAAFAGIALTIAIIGLYGVLAYMVAQQTREIGIRMALGADASRLVRDVLLSGLGLTLAGIVCGLALSAALTRYMASLLYEIRPGDPLTLLGASAALLAVGLFASWLPARRAAAVDPMRSLRQE